LFQIHLPYLLTPIQQIYILTIYYKLNNTNVNLFLLFKKHTANSGVVGVEDLGSKNVGVG